jgi:MFS family permease
MTKFRLSRASFLTTNVLVLSIVSLLADLSTEMIQPILPLFLVGTLGASYSIVGLVEGSSDATTSIVKVISGWYSDRLSRRKPFVVIGYLPAAILKPLLYFVQTPLQVLAIRIPDRIGKGIRGAPRDALIAESVDKQHFGKAFGFHRASDSFGAVLGSLFGFVFLTIIAGTSSDIYRTIFLISTIPAVVSVIIGQAFVKEIKPIVTTKSNKSHTSLIHGIGSFDSKLKFFIIVSSIFAFANFNISFFILKAKDTGLTDTDVVLLYVLYNLVYTAVSYPFGAAADKIGRHKVIMIGFGVYIFTTLGFAFLSYSFLNVIVLFAILGLYIGIFDGSQKAYISEISAPTLKATALGTVSTLTGLITLPSSLVAGILWDRFGSSTTFQFGATVAIIAIVLFGAYTLKFQRTNKIK